MMNKKNLSHIITVVSFVVFIVLGLASASTPPPADAYPYRGYVRTVKNDTGSTVWLILTRDTGTTDLRPLDQLEKEGMDNGTQMDLFYSIESTASKSSSSESRSDVRTEDLLMGLLSSGSSSSESSSSKSSLSVVKNQDICMYDNNESVYVKYNVPIALKSIDSAGTVIDNLDPIIFTAQDRLPQLTIQNNTGYPIRITAPSREEMRDGVSVTFPPELLGFGKNFTVAYDIGYYARYEEQVTVDNDDVTLTLTKRPPEVTIENNTGNTVNLVFVRNPGENWPAENLLNPSTAQSTERRGSITNREGFKLSLGIVRAVTKPDRYDIRLDDVQGNSYVKSNVQITRDMTLTFTPTDKR
jgi:hypothetical protein